MSFTVIDKNSTKANYVKMTFNTNMGYVVFWTDTGSVFEGRTKLKACDTRITWVDVYHGRCEVGA